MYSGLWLSGGNASENGAGSSTRHTSAGQQIIVDDQLTNPVTSQGVSEIGNHQMFTDEETDQEYLESEDEEVAIRDNIPGRKRYHRHSQQQIQQLEHFFSLDAHPGERQRRVLSRKLDLDTLKIKFWFQNKRTQMKAQQERNENAQIKSENDRLRAENARLRDTMGDENALCLNCGGPTAIGDGSVDGTHLCLENIRLKDEIDRTASLAAIQMGNPIPWLQEMSKAENGAGRDPLAPQGLLSRQIAGPMLDSQKQLLVDVVQSAMRELLWLTQSLEPVWQKNLFDENVHYILNEEEYIRSSMKAPGARILGYKWEATREEAIVNVNLDRLVSNLMTVEQWGSLFCSIVAKASPVDSLSTGTTGNYDGVIQLLNVEYQMINTVVPSRETFMARFCKKQGDGLWAVVDISVDGLHTTKQMKFQKRPSGCLIQQIEPGFCKVIWVEHIEVEDNPNLGMYNMVVNQGVAFGAKHWISTLYRQCQRFARRSVARVPQNDVRTIGGRRLMLTLSEKMVIRFCSRAGDTRGRSWTNLARTPGHEVVKVMTNRNANREGLYNGISLSATTSIKLPAAPKAVFDFLGDKFNRPQWDMLSKGSRIGSLAHLTTGDQEENCISMFKSFERSGNPKTMLIVQECFTGPTGFLIVYGSTDIDTIQTLLANGNIDSVHLLPSGFAILPDGSGGTLISMMFQILIDYSLDCKIKLSDVSTVINIMSGTVKRLSSLFGGTYH